MTIDTLKQAVQALRYEAQTTNRRTYQLREQYEKLAAALEAMAEMQPVAWMATRFHSVVIAAKRDDLFAFGQQQHISPLYAVPIATPEHDAKVRGAEPDMFWNAADPERFGGENLHDAVLYAADDICVGDLPAELTFQSAKRLPDVRVRITGYVDEEWHYEIIDDTKSTGANHAK